MQINVRKALILGLMLTLSVTSLFAQNQYRNKVNPTKNVILMIPDGTSIGVYSAARWYQIYNNLDGDRLAVDPYWCGTVKTYNSNAPIGDSAPTTSAYMTGYLSQAGNVSIYPEVDKVHDIHPVDASKSLQPLATVLEAAKYELNKSTGLVVTVEFCHATPADCSSHHYDRGKYAYLASQQVANKVDVVMGGGNRYLTAELEKELEQQGTKVLRDDVEAFRSYNGDENVWALFEQKSFPYDMDRDPEKIPSLAEMTEKAISRLSKDENGFFLMVEGSQVDWAAHGNDAIAMITEYLAFDKAVQVAIDFAKEDKETTVIILSDHGNSGITIGEYGFSNYARRGLDDVFGNVSKYKASSRQLENILLKSKPEDFKQIVKEYTDIDITDEELETLLMSKNYKEGDYMNVSNSINLSSSLTKIMNARTFFGFTTGGHTGEDVLLAAYHPDGHVPLGMNTNLEFNKYLCDVVGLERPLDEITGEIFVKHTDVFEGFDYKIETPKDGFPELVVKKGKKKLVIPAFKSKAYVNDKEIELGSVIVYMDKNETFYLPKSLRAEFEKK